VSLVAAVEALHEQLRAPEEESSIYVADSGDYSQSNMKPCRDITAPLYRLGWALSQLWQAYPPFASLVPSSHGPTPANYSEKLCFAHPFLKFRVTHVSYHILLLSCSFRVIGIIGRDNYSAHSGSF
jgi:hypothetical protein